MIKDHQGHINFKALDQNNRDRPQRTMDPAGSHILETDQTVINFRYTVEDICPFKFLFNPGILAPADLLRIPPLVDMQLRRPYTVRCKNLLATQLVFKSQPAKIQE